MPAISAHEHRILCRAGLASHEQVVPSEVGATMPFSLIPTRTDSTSTGAARDPMSRRAIVSGQHIPRGSRYAYSPGTVERMVKPFGQRHGRRPTPRIACANQAGSGRFTPSQPGRSSSWPRRRRPQFGTESFRQVLRQPCWCKHDSQDWRLAHQCQPSFALTGSVTRRETNAGPATPIPQNTAAQALPDDQTTGVGHG